MMGMKPIYKKIFSDKPNYKIENSVILDLLDIFAIIYIYDIRTIRKKKRRINVEVPVNNIHIWEKVKTKINKLVNYVTNDVDRWTINFTKYNKTKKIKKPILFNKGEIFSQKKIALFSGGLDSFAGICNDIKDIPTKLFLPGFKINNHEYHSQKKLYNDFFHKVDSSINYDIFSLDFKKVEPTQRTRSLLFFALGITVAYSLDITELLLYENGIMSLNPEINYSRYTTKTTHPITINYMNNILLKANINIKISHPFLFKTKGQMINLIPSKYLKYIKETMTCGKSRQDQRFDTSKKQCGACVPCVLRKISMTYANAEKYDTDYDINYDFKIKNEHPLIKEYKSSIKYFIDYKKMIDNDEIFNILNLRNKYYEDSYWFEKTNKLLKQFSIEVDKFINKHKILN